MTDQEALCTHMKQAASGLAQLFNHVFESSIAIEHAEALAHNLESGRAELVFKTKFGINGTRITRSLLYQYDREVLCFENRIDELVTETTQTSGTTHRTPEHFSISP